MCCGGGETAGWCWAEGRRTARAILAALDGRLPESCGPALKLDHPALRLAVRQIIDAAGPDATHKRLQIRLDRPIAGQLRLLQAGRILASARIDSMPERRLGRPIPSDLGSGPLVLTLNERP